MTDPLTGLIVHTAQQLHAFRQDHKQQQPANLKTITTWNVGGWTQPGRAGDEKLRAIKACLMRGPVALQETHWSEEQATKVTTLIPGARAVATPATIKNTHPSGGVADQGKSLQCKCAYEVPRSGLSRHTSTLKPSKIT